ncbi:hypothetical protein CBN_0437 [Clostridium botulinum NCTC 2916]|uniref:Uncharacterized protein n=1 Tax=Clostridium botulinum (strain Kyoto / Type A2) TaxID=536232 RepID=C1FS77_CLOBJ|nr:conserved hypothetical protein [Clostridium botulinum A2 str. Kyoto]EDT82733.1 hypothetical protein CBN_0437 [Clostridium botulinum NCTC 2916]
MFTPVKYAEAISAFNVNGVTTSPDFNTLLLTTPLERYIASAKSLSNSILKAFACCISLESLGVKPICRKKECSFIILPKKRCSSNDCRINSRLDSIVNSPLKIFPCYHNINCIHKRLLLSYNYTCKV